MTVQDLSKKIVADLNEIGNPKLSMDDFNILSDSILERLKLSKMKDDYTDNEMLFLSSLRLHSINSINFIRGAKIQGRFNRLVISKLKETGKDVTTLDSYLNDNVRPYFPDHDE